MNHGGKQIDAVAQGTKHGLLFVFDRVTGEPLWPIEERPVPQSDLVGEQTWPTQPFPTKPPPLMRQAYTDEDASDISPTANQMTRERIQAAPNFGPFPAPSLNETVMFPGFDGGLILIGATADETFRAFDKETGEILWKAKLPFGGNASPSTYMTGGRQYVVISAGGGKSGRPHGGTLVAFALPE